MISSLLTAIFGSKHERFRKRALPVVAEINRIYAELAALSDEALRAKTAELKEKVRQRLEGVTGKDEIKRVTREALDAILPEAFAVVKEACRRNVGKEWAVVGQPIKWDMIPYDVQLIGGIALHEGRVAEMATGEGKTLVAVLPTYLNALTGRGVHIVTVNDYLAQRDSEWMGEIHKFLGLTVGCILNPLDSAQRRDQYGRDITYGTNNEFGFDYLRDNMALDAADMVQRPFYYAIVDEVDSVLIDEARTPLIISGTINVTMDTYRQLNPMVKRLFERQHYINNQLITEARKIAGGDGPKDQQASQETGRRLLQVKLGGPKHKQLQKIFQEPGMKALCDEVENYYIREKKLHELEEQNLYNISERNHSADLTDKGREFMAGEHGDKDLFLLPDLSDELVKIDNDPSLTPVERLKKKEEMHHRHQDRSERIHVISQLLRAYSLFEKDVEYMLSEDGRVVIIDEHTGRALEGRRYSDGLHQAIEAKEGVEVQRESQTLATVTLQNYFRMYEKLAGMTGTAETEENELWEIYKLEVVVVPTNDRVRRHDQQDVIYKTRREKYKAIIEEIKELNQKGRPVLVGTISVEVSELLSTMLKRHGVKCNVLNAKHHRQEAEIVSQAGRYGGVTIATNMAGRGTDIKLGEKVVEYVSPGVKEGAKGGLFVIGTERHESRRIDRQLRGRSGRQGDPGDSRFYLSLEDDLMRLFGSDRITRIMDRLGMKEDEPIMHPWITKSVERAQKRVEARNFEVRKHLLEYDNVMNIMRTEIYKRRRAALTGEAMDEVLATMIEDALEDILIERCGDNLPSGEWDWAGLKGDLLSVFAIQIEERHDLSLEQFLDDCIEKAKVRLAEKKAFVDQIDPALFERVKRIHVLRTIDDFWKDHLYDMDCLREGINLQAYGQKDPLIEYKKEGFSLFEKMLQKVNRTAVERIFNTSVTVEEQRGRNATVNVRFSKAEAGPVLAGAAAQAQGPGVVPGMEGPQQSVNRTPVKVAARVGPNEPCPCGSGKKYKKCHG